MQFPKAYIDLFMFCVSWLCFAEEVESKRSDPARSQKVRTFVLTMIFSGRSYVKKHKDKQKTLRRHNTVMQLQ